MPTVPQTEEVQRETVNIRIFTDTQREILQEQTNRKVSGEKPAPTFADIVEEAWRAYKTRRRK